MKGDSALVCKHRDGRGGKLRARLPSELLRGREHDATTSCGGGARHMFNRINAKADPAETTHVAAPHPDIVAKRAALRREPHVPTKLCPIRVLDADRSSSPRRFLHFETTAPGATSIEGTFSDILAFPRSLRGSEPWGDFCGDGGDGRAFVWRGPAGPETRGWSDRRGPHGRDPLMGEGSRLEPPGCTPRSLVGRTGRRYRPIARQKRASHLSWQLAA